MVNSIPDPGVARAWVGDQSPGLEAVVDQEPGPVLGTRRVIRPEVGGWAPH